MITDKTILGKKLAHQIKAKMDKNKLMHQDSVQACKKILKDYFSDNSLSIEFLATKHKICKATFYKYCKLNQIDFRQDALNQQTINNNE